MKLVFGEWRVIYRCCGHERTYGLPIYAYDSLVWPTFFVWIYPKRSDFTIELALDELRFEGMKFPKGYRKLKDKKAYVELMLRLGEWDKILEDL